MSTDPPAADPADPADSPVSGLQLEELLQIVDAQLLGGTRTLTSAQVAEAAQTPLPNLRRLWRSLGFAGVESDLPMFTEADVDAVEHVRALQRLGDVDDELMVTMVRIIGQSFARLASWQAQLVVEMIAGKPELVNGEQSDVGQLMDLLVPTVERIQSYVWRRQLAAVFERMAANSGAGDGDGAAASVGFVDMAGFTSFTRSATETQLREVLSAFETLSTEVVGANGGQIVKTIGDEVLYVCPDAHGAAQIALTLLEQAQQDEVLPRLRAGVARGEVVSRLGDVYGQTVNIASRLTALARPDTVLVDQGMAAALAEDEAFHLRPLRAVSVRGYRHLHSWRLRRDADRTAVAPSR